MSTNKILTLIEDKRKELASIVSSSGLSSSRTIRCSQQLDDLLNQYTYTCQHHSMAQESQPN